MEHGCSGGTPHGTRVNSAVPEAKPLYCAVLCIYNIKMAVCGQKMRQCLQGAFGVCQVCADTSDPMGALPLCMRPLLQGGMPVRLAGRAAVPEQRGGARVKGRRAPPPLVTRVGRTRAQAAHVTV